MIKIDSTPEYRTRVLIADDDWDTRAILSDALAHHGYEPIVASDGEKALALAATRSLEIACVDLVMPGPAGLELADRLKELQDNFYTAMTFDAAAEAGTSETLVEFASNSVGWLQTIRETANTEHEFRTTVYERSLDALSKDTGVNLDYEMTLLLQLERSYQATSRLIATVDTMYESLLSAAR